VGEASIGAHTIIPKKQLFNARIPKLTVVVEIFPT
jgi:hypothetical protein